MKPLAEYAQTYRGPGGYQRDYPAWFDAQPDGQALLEEIRIFVKTNVWRRDLAGLVDNWLQAECGDRPIAPPGRSALRRLVMRYRDEKLKAAPDQAPSISEEERERRVNLVVDRILAEEQCGQPG